MSPGWHEAHPQRIPVEFERVKVLANDRVAEGVGLLVLEAPRVAKVVRPGQFVHLRVTTRHDFMLRRPFSVHGRRDGAIELLYQVVGEGTKAMAARKRGQVIDLLGPIGRGWHVPEDTTHALLVAGGLGAAPLVMLAEELAAAGIAIAVAQGAPTADRLVSRSVFDRVARRIEVATDDGSAGEHGFVTRISERMLAEERFDVVYTCGPEPMQRIVAAQAAAHGAYCEVSLERLMACGIGVCLSCVCETTHGLRRSCVDGPVFSAKEVDWEASDGV